MAYLLDTNVFITAKALHYGMDFCPGFWQWLVKAAKAGVVASIEQVHDELQDDELRPWLPKLGTGFFRSTDLGVVSAMERVSSWAMSAKYDASAKHTFLSSADYFLLAHALADDSVVVTHEQFSNSTAHIKIPNACIALGVKHCRTDQMLRRERVRLVLKRPT